MKPPKKPAPTPIVRVHVARVPATPEKLAADRRFWEAIIGRVAAPEKRVA